MSERVKVGLVGVGHMGRLHLKKILEEPRAELVGVFDSDYAKATSAAQEYGVRIAPSLAELFFESQAVFICSSTPSHFAVAREALQSGLHVFVEKPLCQTAAQAEELVQLALESNRILQVGFVERYRIIRVLREAALGQIYFIEAVRHSTAPGREPGLDAVLDLMIHDIDLACWLAGDKPQRLSAVGTSFGVSDLDVANAQLEFGSGILADLQASWFAPERKRFLTIYAERGCLTIDLIANTVSLVASQPSDHREKRVLPAMDPLQEQCNAFLMAVAQESRPVVTGADGLIALEVASQIQRAALQRQTLVRSAERRPLDLGERGVR